MAQSKAPAPRPTDRRRAYKGRFGCCTHRSSSRGCEASVSNAVSHSTAKGQSVHHLCALSYGTAFLAFRLRVAAVRWWQRHLSLSLSLFLVMPAAKNLVLAGVQSVAVHDAEPVAMADLGANFYLTAADVGANRAEVCPLRPHRVRPDPPCTCGERSLVLASLPTRCLGLHPVGVPRQARGAQRGGASHEPRSGTARCSHDRSIHRCGRDGGRTIPCHPIALIESRWPRPPRWRSGIVSRRSAGRPVRALSWRSSAAWQACSSATLVRSSG